MKEWTTRVTKEEPKVEVVKEEMRDDADQSPELNGANGGTGKQLQDR